MTLAALILDVDGTLVDTEELHRQAFNAAFLQLGLYWDWSPQHYVELLHVSGGADRLAHYIARLGVDSGEHERLQVQVPVIHRCKTAIYRDLIASGRLALRPGVAQLLTEARAAGLKIAAASTSASENAALLLAGLRIDGEPLRFETVVSADMVAAPKPAVDLYARVLATLRLPAAACLAIEDSANGVRAAKAAGLVAVAVPTRWTVEQNLSHADLVLHSLAQLPAPLAALREAHRRASLLRA